MSSRPRQQVPQFPRPRPIPRRRSTTVPVATGCLLVLLGLFAVIAGTLFTGWLVMLLVALFGLHLGFWKCAVIGLLVNIIRGSRGVKRS